MNADGVCLKRGKNLTTIVGLDNVAACSLLKENITDSLGFDLFEKLKLINKAHVASLDGSTIVKRQEAISGLKLGWIPRIKRLAAWILSAQCHALVLRFVIVVDEVEATGVGMVCATRDKSTQTNWDEFLVKMAGASFWQTKTPGRGCVKYNLHKR